MTFWGEQKGPFKLLDTLMEETSLPFNSHTDEHPIRNNVKHCLRKISDGHYSVVVKVLTSFEIASNTPKTGDFIEKKHSQTPLPNLPCYFHAKSSFLINTETIHHCIKFFPKGTFYGRDGLRSQHLLDAFCGAESTLKKSFL